MMLEAGSGQEVMESENIFFPRRPRITLSVIFYFPSYKFGVKVL